MPYILAHDFGTTGDKASLFTIEGEFVKTKTVGYPTHYSHGTWAEQDAEDWWRAFCESTTALMEGIDTEEVLCVAFDGTYPNCLCVDSDLKPLHRVMIWQDTRAYREAEEISRKLPPKYTAYRSSGIMGTDRTLPKLLWLRKHRPDIYEKTYKVFPSVMDYIILKMTGHAVCDRETGAGTGMTNVERTEWSAEVMEIAGIPMDILPELHDATDIVGEVPAHLAAECGLAAGTKLVMGTGDSRCTSIGAGMLNTGDAYLNGGTSAGILLLPEDGGRRGGSTTSSGASLNWLKNNFCLAEQLAAKETGRDVYDIINEEIAKAPVGSHGVMYHPYLAGERAPRNNPRAKGSFVGLSLTSNRQDIMRSVVEGIGLNVNLILQEIRDMGYIVERMPIVGGMAKGEVTKQIFADIMNVELETFEYTNEAATVGAAVFGGIAMGIYEDVSAVRKFIKVVSVTKPNKENHEMYKALMPLFEKVYEAMVPVYEDM